MLAKPSRLKVKSDCSVVIVESASSVRQMISDTLKDLGFEKITGVTSPKDALHILEVEKVDWIITSLSAAEDVNALHILKIITMQTRLRATQVTLLWDTSSDDTILSHAFELGLLSVHPKSYMRDSLSECFQQLFEIFKLHNWDSTLVAAEYIRQYLVQKNLHKTRLLLEETLLALYPGSAKILLNIAEAELALDQLDRGKMLLDQIELIDDRMTSHCRRLRQKYQVDDGTPEALNSGAKNILGIRNAVLIDPDTDVLFHSKDLLSKVGVADVETFESGTDAFHWLSSGGQEPDLIIMEWKIPGITGAMLVQRIRSLGFYKVPIIIISSLIKNSDIHILREMGVDECQEKPFDQGSFYGIVIRAIQQNRSPTEEKSLHQKITRLLKAEQVREAERLIAQLLQDERTSEGTRKEIEAEYHMAKGELEKARDAGLLAIKVGGDTLNMLNLIGKAMLKLRQFEGALKCFERANSISSLNVERILDIADACIESNKIDEAVEAVAAAKSLDISNDSVHQMDCKVSIISGRSDIAKNLMNDLESGKNIISYMNNRAVALARSGRFDDAIELYRKTLESIPPTWKPQVAAVIYNTGLAHARYGDLEKAASTLETLSSNGSDVLTFKRAKSLLTKIKQSISSSTRLILSTDDGADNELFVLSDPPNNKPDPGTTKDSNEFAAISIQLDLQRGEIGCHLVFYDHDKLPIKLLERIPNFKERKGIDEKSRASSIK